MLKFVIVTVRVHLWENFCVRRTNFCVNLLRMADSKMVVSPWSPEFVTGLLPAAQKTALLYNLSYLCLTNFPNLERIIRSRAVETQLLFGSSDATLLKCILTSENLVQLLFPMLTTAVEKNKPNLAVKFLGKAGDWIKEIVTDVEKIVGGYDLHNKVLASTTSDVVKEKDAADKKFTSGDNELKNFKKCVNDLEIDLQKITEALAETEKRIQSKSKEIQELVRSVPQKNGLTILAALVPFVGPILRSIYYPIYVARMKELEAEFNCLTADQNVLKQKEWLIQLKITDLQMTVAKASFDQNSIPDPIHLKEVQSSLTKIQAILIQLRNFWENVAKMLDFLKQRTFVGEDLIGDLIDLKDEFLESIKVAKEAWSSFGAGCTQASVIFKLQTKDAYKFLEISPSSLSSEEWKKQYESVKKQLEKIDRPPSVTSSVKPAISQ